MISNRTNLLRVKFCRSSRRWASNAAKRAHGTKWVGVVGLEVHAQIETVSKLFSGASTTFGCPPNTNVSFFDAAIPGTLPVLNRRCVDHAISTALSLNSSLNMVSFFDRKHYFYADLPAGYQVTQQRRPIAVGGFLELPSEGPCGHKKVRIRQIQLEQDSGKSIHDFTDNRSLIDLNRAGMGLMEIVFEPDLNNGEEAASLVKELVLVLSTLGSCSCKMEEGALRVDANISVNPAGSKELGTRTEVKNIGSVRAVAKAVDWEIKRQISLLNNNEIVENETRAWDTETEVTVPMRDKEVSQDYRFMPEPNLLPLRLDQTRVDELKKSLPELPRETRLRLVQDYGLPALLAFRLVNENYLLNIFWNILKQERTLTGRTVANFLLNELLAFANKEDNFDLRKINATHICDLIKMLDEGEINLVTAKNVLEEIKFGDKDPRKVVEEKGLKLLRDTSDLKALCDRVITENPKAVQEYRNGKVKVFSALMGKAAKLSGGTADMKIFSQLLKDCLSKN